MSDITLTSVGLYFPMPVTLVILAGLALAVCLDVLSKWWAFARVESIAVHIATFMTLYCVVNALENREVWPFKLVMSFVVLLIIAGINAFARLSLEKQIRGVFDNLTKKMDLPENLREALPALCTVTTYATAVALTKIRRGKKDRRTDLAKALRDLGYAPTQGELTEASFYLQRGKICVFVSLTILSAVSVFVAVMQLIPTSPPAV